jgi:hypothetical protein
LHFSLNLHCPSLGTLQKFPDQPGGIAHDTAALQGFLSLIKEFDLGSVGPVDPGNIPAEKAAVFRDNFFAETFQQLVGKGPHSRVLDLFLPAPAELQAEDSQSPDCGAANLTIPPQAAPESAHGPDDFIPFLPQLLLPDRKNGLASMETLLHHLFRFPQHLFQRHDAPPSPPRKISKSN